MTRTSVKGVAAGLIVVVIAAVCIRLGFWQLDRLEQRRALNARLTTAMAAPILALDSSAVAAVAAAPERFEYRPARAVGVWDQSASFLLRGRARGGAPGVHLVTPLRLEGSPVALLVDRGWLPAADATTADPRPYRVPGRVAVEGMIRLPPPPNAGSERRVDLEFDGLPVATYQRLLPSRLAEHYDLALLPFYIERAQPQGDERTLPLGALPPRLDEGPHLGYALQWFSFAAIAVIGFSVVVVRQGRRQESG